MSSNWNPIAKASGTMVIWSIFYKKSSPINWNKRPWKASPFLKLHFLKRSFIWTEVLKENKYFYKPRFSAKLHFIHQVRRSTVKCQEIANFQAVTGWMWIGLAQPFLFNHLAAKHVTGFSETVSLARKSLSLEKNSLSLAEKFLSLVKSDWF